MVLAGKADVMAVGAGFGYFSAALGGVRLGELGVVGRGPCSSAPVVVNCRVGVLAGLSDSTAAGMGLVLSGAAACVCVPSGIGFARPLLGRVWRVARWQCLAEQWVVSGSLRGAILGAVLGPDRVSSGSAGGRGAVAGRSGSSRAVRLGQRGCGPCPLAVPCGRAAGWSSLWWQRVLSACGPGVVHKVTPPWG